MVRKSRGTRSSAKLAADHHPAIGPMSFPERGFPR